MFNAFSVKFNINWIGPDEIKQNVGFEIGENSECKTIVLYALYQRFFIYVYFAGVLVLLCSCVDDESTWRHLSIFPSISKPLVPI